jgi:mRNA interferase RelE/StbE
LSNSKFRIEFRPGAVKSLKRLHPAAQTRILQAAALLQLNPIPPKAKRLIGEQDLWRIRVGEYRVIYEIQNDVLVVLVVAIGHRREIYKSR